jgi:Chaperone of endosialidase
MAAQPTAAVQQPPPDLPSMPDVSPALTGYLRTFALWCRNGFVDKLDKLSALPGLMLQAYGVAASNPPVFMLEVNAAGKLMLAPMALGSGDVGTPVPVGSDRLSTGGGTVDGDLTVNGHLGVDDGISTNGGNVFYQAAGSIPQVGPGSFMIQASGSGDAFATYHCPGAYATNLGLSPNSHFYIGGWSAGAVAWQIWSSRDFANPACDYRIKENIEPLPSTWDEVKALRPIKYRQKEYCAPEAPKSARPIVEADDRERWGFVAHELQETLGDTAAHCGKDDPDRLQAPNLMAVVAALTRTVQELQARVEEMER